MPAVERFSERLPYADRDLLLRKIAYTVKPHRYMYTTEIDGYDVVVRQLHPHTHLPQEQWYDDDGTFPRETLTGNYVFNSTYFVRPITGEVLEIPFAEWASYECTLVKQLERDIAQDMTYFWYRKAGTIDTFQPPNAEVLLKLKLDDNVQFDGQGTHGLIKAMQLLVPVVEHLADATGVDIDKVAEIKNVCGDLLERHNFVDIANRKIAESKHLKEVDFDELLSVCESEAKASDAPHEPANPTDEIPTDDSYDESTDNPSEDDE